MTTELRRFREGYATMTVATYEPLIMQWWSGVSISFAADQMAWRMQKARRLNLGQDGFSTAYAISVAQRNRTSPSSDTEVPPANREQPSLMNVDDVSIKRRDIDKITADGLPDAYAVNGVLYPKGVLDFVADPKERSADRVAQPSRPIETLPTFSNMSMGRVDPDFDYTSARRTLFACMFKAVQDASFDPNRDVEQAILESLEDVDGVQVYDFLPRVGLLEALSPIGIAHFYRQHYFNIEEGVGPIEEAFTIAPLETLEVAYETTRRQIHEEFVEFGSETVSETATDTKNLDEISDKVSSMVQRDFSAAMSANASGTVGVWQGGASASASFGTSAERSRELTTRNLKETTKRASERITKSFSIKTRDVEDVTTTTLTRRVLRNESEDPVSYGLRRVLRRVRVKIQSLGPRLVWQLYIRDPGLRLGVSRFVIYREDEPLGVPEIPPGVPPRPKGGTDTGTTTRTVESELVEGRNINFIHLSIPAGLDRIVTGVSIDAIQDLEGGGGMSEEDDAPSPLDIVQWDAATNLTTGVYTVKVGIHKGDASAVSVSYSYSWKPAPHVVKEWEDQRKQAVDTATQAALTERFELEKAKIEEKSKIRVRPANELRREERYEVLSRMVSHLFARGDDPSDPTPIEIESVNRYFDIDGMFVYRHPSWWRPRYVPVEGGLGREAYPITAESEPASLGSSLGWRLQIDGDNRRNEFLNSPWVRICLPIRSERERAAIAWLAKHVEGAFGYDPEKAPLQNLLEEIDAIRSNEQSLGMEGPDYVTVDSTPGAPAEPLTPEAIFPVIDEFDVTVPTDGFVYDRLVVVDE